MFHQSKILVWYKVASQKVILGEALIHQHQDVVSLWLHTPIEDPNREDCPPNQYGYQLSLFDDGGREIAQKSVSGSTVDRLLFGIKASA